MASSGARNRAPYLIGLHTNEGQNAPGDEGRDRSAENLVSWMTATGNSYHVVADDDSLVRMVPDDRAAYAMLSANGVSLNLCFTGWAHWTRAEWLEHPAMLALGAAQVREWCATYSIPVRHLTPAQVGTNESGLLGHGDWSIGKRDGDHTDPGAGFPWDVFVALILDPSATTEGADDVLDADQNNRLTEAWQDSSAAKDGVANVAAVVTEIRNLLLDQNIGLFKRLGTMAGVLAGLKAAESGVDLAAVEAAAEKGARDALTGITLEVRP